MAAFPPSHGALYRSTYNPEIVCRVEWYQGAHGEQRWRMVNLATGGTRHTFSPADGAGAFSARYVPAGPDETKP